VSTSHRDVSKRRRHDSDSDDDKDRGHGRDSSIERSAVRRRHNSDSDEESDKKKRRRHDSSDDEIIQRSSKQRHDSDSDSDSEKYKRSKGRHDRHGKDKAKSKHKRRRYDSSSEDEAPKMSSGHKSGLQSSSDFAKAEHKLQKNKRDQLSSLNKPEGETIYRDAEGKKRSIPMGVDRTDADIQREEEEKSRLLNRGTYQKLQDERARMEFDEVKDMPLARGVEDFKMEERRRNVIREGDPMAMYAWKVCVVGVFVDISSYVHVFLTSLVHCSRLDFHCSSLDL
jgi:pre-mRNA-splicing factor CWC26